MPFGFLKRRRRAELRAQPVPAEWRDILERNVPAFHRLPSDDRTELLGHVRVFLAEKHFEGCAGLELTDEIRVTIAGQACLLLLHRETDYYPRLTSVLVYPSAYFVPGAEHVGHGIWEEQVDPYLGHTQQTLGAMVLAWDSARHGATNPLDGDNLVLHEFAHQLDFEDGVTDGTPLLDGRRQYAAWARVMEAEFRALRDAEARGRPTVLDTYGAEDPAEFFAVATEAFFERPRQLKARHPELYAELETFFRQDPATHGQAEDEPVGEHEA
jgi:Mlc titration factor MtfA (ptsG expression regulator)